MHTSLDDCILKGQFFEILFTCKGQDLIVLNPKHVEVHKHARIWASRDFAYRLQKNRKPESVPAVEESGESKLGGMIATCFPNYVNLCSARFIVKQLLRDHDNTAD